MFNSKNKKMVELIKRKKETGEALTFDETVFELTSKDKERWREEIKQKIKTSLIIIAYLIALIISRSSPIIAAILATSTVFVVLVLVLIEDGKIDLNGLHKKDGFGWGVYVFLACSLPVYLGIYLGYEDKKFESFLLKNECSYLESGSSEAEYYCSKPNKKISRSLYDYIESNIGFNADWVK